MHPIRLIGLIGIILVLNYALAFLVVFGSLLAGLYTSAEFLDKMILIASLPSAYGGLFYNFFSKHKIDDFNDIDERLNIYTYCLPTIAIAIVTCVAFDLGIYLGLANIAFSDTEIKAYFLFIQVGIGSWFSSKLLPDLFKFANHLKF